MILCPFLRRKEKRLALVCHILLVGFDHLLHHLTAYGAGLTAGQIAVIALLEIYADFLWRFFTSKHTLFCTKNALIYIREIVCFAQTILFCLKIEKKGKIMQTIAIVNQKGGVGKSTTAVNLGAGLVRQGKRVLLIDADSQANLTEMLGWQQPDELSPTLATMLERIISDRPIEPQAGILHHTEGMDLLPANIELSGLEVSLVNTMSRETVLRTYLNEVKRQYDYILVDCSPSLGMLTLNALTAADRVIIPVQSHYLPVKGLEQLLHTVSKVQRQLNSNLKISGILITMTESRTNFSKEISQLVRNAYGKAIRVYDTEIPRGIKAAEMSARGTSIFSFDPRSPIATAYEKFTKEVLEHEKCREKYPTRQL